MHVRNGWVVVVLSLLCASHVGDALAAQRKPHNVVLVTLDGVRVQEMFGGVDIEVLRSTLGKDAKLEDSLVYQRYWATTPEQRRAKVMPFFWNTLMREHGSVAGNPAHGSRVQISNKMGFSYPGYAEILTGRAHDDVITSNDNVPSPFPTVLEFVRNELQLPKEQVATLASWAVQNGAAEQHVGATFTNAGIEPYDDADPLVQQINALQAEAVHADDVRYDAFTSRLALIHLQRQQPRLLFVSFDETDHWAHSRHYQYTLDAMARTDRFLQQLWTWLQSQPQYRDNTTLIVTTDHGRGNTPEDWSDHGKVEGAQNIWLAMAGPLDARRGEWSDAPTLHQDQIAATIAAAFGLDYRKQDPQAGKAIVFEAK